MQDSPLVSKPDAGGGGGLDTSVANAARMWNYWIGGKDNFAADRAAGERVLKAMPALPLIARLLRLFLIRTVDELTMLGIRQFLDIGTGLPTADNTHEVAQRAAPESRIVYVDHDPVVISHARALLTSSPEGKTGYIQADLRDWPAIVAGAREILDFTQPIAVLLIAVLHFIADAEDPHRMISQMMADLAPGSYLVIAHAASDIEAKTAAAMAHTYNATSSLMITPRDQATVTRFFDGLELTGQGLQSLARWSGSSRGTIDGSGLSCYCGVARKPLSVRSARQQIQEGHGHAVTVDLDWFPDRLDHQPRGSQRRSVRRQRPVQPLIRKTVKSGSPRRPRMAG